MIRYLIHKDNAVYFNGFAWRHQGTNKSGELFSKWISDTAMLIPPSALQQTVADLKSIGDEHFTIKEVDI